LPYHFSASPRPRPTCGGWNAVHPVLQRGARGTDTGLFDEWPGLAERWCGVKLGRTMGEVMSSVVPDMYRNGIWACEETP
jgi:hypothetical protein